MKRTRASRQLPPDRGAMMRERLLARGHHLTRQRSAVYDYLTRVDSHPTAEAVFLAVKRALPRISLATVYKSLEALVACGLASKLTYGDYSARYDIRTDDHFHMRCLACGKLKDLEAGQGSQWLRRIRPSTDFRVMAYRLELLGYCDRCRR